MKDILEKNYSNYEEIIYDLTNNFYPDCEIVKSISWVKDCHKYQWCGNLVFKYFNELYLVDIDAIGNGGWLSIDDCKVVGINKVKKVVKLVEEISWELI